MKTLKNILCAALLMFSFQAIAQTDEATTSKIVDNKHYTFVATAANPLNSAEMNRIMNQMNNGMGSSRINLVGYNYDLKVTPDSLVAFLPFYGRTFNAPTNPSEGGIKFTSKDFKYKETKNKRGTRIINIRTNDLKTENYNLIISINKNGYATLNSNSNNKQAISYDGYLQDPQDQKK